MRRVYAFQIEEIVRKGIDVFVLDMKNGEVFTANNAEYSKVISIINDHNDYFFWTKVDYEESD